MASRSEQIARALSRRVESFGPISPYEDITSAIRFLELSTASGRTSEKVLDYYNGRFLAIRTTTPLTLRFRQHEFDVKFRQKFFHNWEQIFLSHDAQTGGKIELAYSDDLTADWDFEDLIEFDHLLETTTSWQTLNLRIAPFWQTLNVAYWPASATDVRLRIRLQWINDTWSSSWTEEILADTLSQGFRQSFPVNGADRIQYGYKNDSGAIDAYLATRLTL